MKMLLLIAFWYGSLKMWHNDMLKLKLFPNFLIDKLGYELCLWPKNRLIPNNEVKDAFIGKYSSCKNYIFKE